MGKKLTSLNKWSCLCVAVFAAFYFFAFSTNSALAGGNGWTAGAEGVNDYIYFRIDTELDVLNAKGVTVEWSCGGNGETSGSYSVYKGSVTDGISLASDSDNTVDGIVSIASQSAENTGTNGSGCDVGEVVTATVSLGGWVTRVWDSVALTDTNFTTRASMDYTIRVNGVADELSTALTLDGTTASASYSGTVASQSYSNSGGTWRKYIAGSTTGGTVTGGADGYVNRATTSTLTVSATASTSVDFGVTATTSAHNESGLLFGHKIQVFQSGGNFTDSKITYGTVVAGNSLGTACTMGTSGNTGSGYWYCPVPLAHTGTSARYSGNFFQTTTETYTDRTTGSDVQELTVISPIANVSGGGGSTTTTTTTTTTPTPTPTPTPSEEPTPTLTPSTSSGQTTPSSKGFISLEVLNLKEGDIISASGSDDPDIYIANDWGYKRLFLNPVIFGFYGHLGGFSNVKTTTSTTRDTMVTSGLFRNCETDDPKVYGVEVTAEDAGTLHWVNTTGEQAVADDSDFFKKVFCINSNEFSWYPQGTDYTSVNQVPVYSR